jgi:hypothetical protein
MCDIPRNNFHIMAQPAFFPRPGGKQTQVRPCVARTLAQICQRPKNVPVKKRHSTRESIFYAEIAGSYLHNFVAV